MPFIDTNSFQTYTTRMSKLINCSSYHHKETNMNGKGIVVLFGITVVTSVIGWSVGRCLNALEAKLRSK